MLLLFSHSVVPNSLMTPCTVVCQAPLSMRFPRQEYWSGLPCSPPGESSWPRVQTHIFCIAGRFFTAEPPGSSYSTVLSAVSTVFTKQICKTFSSCMIEIIYLLNSNSLSALPPQTLAVSILLSVSVSLIASDTLCKWNHDFVLPWLAYFTWCNACCYGKPV